MSECFVIDRPYGHKMLKFEVAYPLPLWNSLWMNVIPCDFPELEYLCFNVDTAPCWFLPHGIMLVPSIRRQHCYSDFLAHHVSGRYYLTYYSTKSHVLSSLLSSQQDC